MSSDAAKPLLCERSTDHWHATTAARRLPPAASDDAILFEATIATDAGTARVYDAFVLRDGKATHLFTGVLSFTPRGETGGST